MRAPLLRSSTARLALLYLCGVVVGVSALLWTVFLLTQRVMDSQVDLVIQTEIQSLREDYRGGGVKRLVGVLDQRVDDWGRLGAVYLLLDPQGQQLAGNLSSWPLALAPQGEWREFEISASEHGREVSHPVRAALVALGGNRLLVGTDLSERRRFMQRLRATTLWGIGLTALLMALIGWWYSRRVAARVRGMAQACATIISGDLSRRLPLDGSFDEFDQLAGAVNVMLDRIEQQTAAVRITFNSAAHDLRAPLHRIRARLEGQLQGASADAAVAAAVQATIADVERLQRTLAMLLQIAQADAGGGSAQEAVDLAQLASELHELYAPEAREREVSLILDAPGAAVISGHRQLLAQLCVNLLENAVKYVPAGGRVELSVRRELGQVILAVSDNGPGIPESQRASMLLPFRRLERDAVVPGSGLGLSLVAAVVRLHGGTLKLCENAPGLLVRCSFPAR